MELKKSDYIIDSLEQAESRIITSGGGSLIKKPDFVTVILKRATARGGLCEMKDYRIRKNRPFRVYLPSLRGMDITDRNGTTHPSIPVINHFDEFGRDLGWVFVELFTD